MSLPSAVRVRAFATRKRGNRGVSHANERDGTNNGRLAVPIYSEEFFAAALHLERKRTERSQGRFVLMLITGTVGSRGVSENVNALVAALGRSIRETDVIGWFKAGAEIGVIFADVGEGEEQAVITALRQRVTVLLEADLTVETVDEIRLEFHAYPERWDDHGQHPEDLEALYPDLTRKRESGRAAHFAKRALDITGSFLALVFFLPLFLAIGIAVKLSSRGPVLFRQERVGYAGKRFTFLKFRSMYHNNDHTIHKTFVSQFISGATAAGKAADSGSAVFKLTHDPRVTPLGKILRKTSLDELPQFWNVLCGDMSLVGPRPPVPYEFEAYATWHRRRLLEARPGITGLWQVEGRSRLSFAEMVRLDLKYAGSWSVWLDLKILLRTPSAVFSGEGAQ